MNKLLLLLYIWGMPLLVSGQNNPPWERPLKIAWSTNGTLFFNESIFQDSSGVPSVIRWKGDTMVCVFQWFRAPIGSPTWDRVAVKYSFDNGATWTIPVPIVVNGLPGNYQRPFDPTLARLNSDSVRIYFSSSIGIPPMGLDSTVNTYSAVSADGMNYTFEPGARFDHPSNKVIDPAVLFFNRLWHYTCPIGAPQDGAYHATSPDGINFTQQPNLPSDPSHNWTGNLCYENNTVMKFYGSGPSIWHNSTSDGYSWTGYVATNLAGGDPSAVKIAPNNYFIIFVGPPYTTTLFELPVNYPVTLFPNPVSGHFYIHNPGIEFCRYLIYDAAGNRIHRAVFENNAGINILDMQQGVYYIKLEQESGNSTILPFIKQ